MKMFVRNSFVTLLALAAPFLVRAEVIPTAPAPGDVSSVGSTCNVAWNGDTNSTTLWKSMAIELMTGDNFNMIHLTTVATNQDGTVNGQYSFPCPDVTPNAAIYFYQFSSPQADNQWTGRFAIASADGKTVLPQNSKQPGTGEAIAWGVGALVDPSKAVAAPSFASSGSVSASLSSPQANSSTVAVKSTSVPPVLSSAITAVVSSSARLTATTTKQSAAATTTDQASGALGAMTPDVRVLGAAVAALVMSFVW